MNKKIFSSFFCALLICVSAISLGGCSGRQYTYSEFVDAYQTYVNTNKVSANSTTAIFDANGLVSVQYSNPYLADAIAGSTEADFQLMYTRLTSDPESSQAVFEPALKASMLFMNKYVSGTSEANVPVDRSNQLYSELVTLADKTKDFQYNLTKFNVRDDGFDKTSLIDKTFLQDLFDSYYDLIIASCALSLDFIDVANNYIFDKVEDSATGRVGAGNIEKYYLAELTECVDTYARYNLATFYKQAYIVDGVEYYTNLKPAAKVNAILSSYEANKAALVAFENRYNAGEMSDAEKAVVKAYRQSQNYMDMYEAAKAVASGSLNKAGDITDDLDEDFSPTSTQIAHKTIIKAFVANECVNKANLLCDIMDKIALL